MSTGKPAHPRIGVEYEVAGSLHQPGLPDDLQSSVPIGYDDFGNLQVDHYSPSLDESKTLVWNNDAFAELVDEGTLVPSDE